jgi:uncharacterized protein (TIGR02246 family)
MKDFLPLVLVLIAWSNSFAQATETAQIEEFVTEYEEIWQSHDAERLAALYAEDADMMFGIQPRIIGREAIETWWSNYFSHIDSGRQLAISIDSIRILSPYVALINVETTTGGTHSQTNEALESRKARGTWIVTRSRDSWTISALRAHSPIGQLREAPGRDN